MSRLLVGLAVTALLVGASTTAAPVPTHLMRKGPPLYFPTWVGAKWVYSDGTKGVFGDIDLTLSVTAVEETDAGMLVTVTNHEPNGGTSLYQKVLVTPGGLEDVEGSRDNLTSRRWILKTPCVVGDKWDVDDSSPDFVRKRSWTMLGTEEVEVPAGKVTAVKVRSKLEWGRRGGGALDIMMDRSCVVWYAPGVGVVKRQFERMAVSPMVLKSFSP